MLIKYTFDQKVFNFTREKERTSEQNVFTILVGKNGTGKSRLLSGLVNESLGKRSNETIFEPNTLGIDSGRMSDKLVYDGYPEKIIAVSTSPFDKFPLPRRNAKHSDYSYWG